MIVQVETEDFTRYFDNCSSVEIETSWLEIDLKSDIENQWHSERVFVYLRNNETNHKRAVRVIHWESNGKQHTLVTDCVTYILNDQGKTLRRV